MPGAPDALDASKPDQALHGSRDLSGWWPFQGEYAASEDVELYHISGISWRARGGYT